MHTVAACTEILCTNLWRASRSVGERKLEPDILREAAAVTEARGDGWTRVLGENQGAVRVHKDCSDRKQKKLDFCHVRICLQ